MKAIWYYYLSSIYLGLHLGRFLSRVRKDGFDAPLFWSTRFNLEPIFSYWKELCNSKAYLDSGCGPKSTVEWGTLKQVFRTTCQDSCSNLYCVIQRNFSGIVIHCKLCLSHSYQMLSSCACWLLSLELCPIHLTLPVGWLYSFLTTSRQHLLPNVLTISPAFVVCDH